MKGNQQLVPGDGVETSLPQRMMSIEENGNDVRINQQNAHFPFGRTAGP
jgi:hypothetical protein